MDQTEGVTLTKQILNNFIMKNKPIACKSKKFVIDKLIRQVKKLRQKKARSEEQKKLFERKADRLVEEAVILKRIRAATVLKFGLLNKKSFARVVSLPDCKIEERALCRLMEQKHLHEVVSSFRKNYPKYEQEVPLILQTLGLQKINNRKKKISILTKWDKLDPYLQTEELNVMIMKDLLGIDINTGILRFCKGKKFEEIGKISGRDKETKETVDAQIKNRNLNNDNIEKEDLTKIKESTNKCNLRIVTSDDKSNLDISASPIHDQNEGEVIENEEEGNEEDSADQGESSDVDEEDSEDVLQEEEDNDDDENQNLHQDEEGNNSDLEGESHGDNSEDDSGQNDDSTKISNDLWVYKSSIVKSEKVSDKILVKRKLIETCHYDDGLIDNKHDKSLPSKRKKSCNIPDLLPAQNRKIHGSGTAEVRILSLSEHDGLIERSDSIKSDSSEEDFFFRHEIKKKDGQRNLFDSQENPEDRMKMQSKDNRKGYYEQNDDIIDTSIYFKRNMYRKVGDTENRDQGQESRGFDINIGGREESRLSWKNNNRGNDDSKRGRPSWRNNDSERNRPPWRNNDSERGRSSWRNNDSERGRSSWRNNSLRNKGNFEGRSGKWKFSHDNPNEIPVEWNWEAKRKQTTDARDWSNDNNRQKDKAVSFESYEGTKTAPVKGPKDQGLHPSWQAKRRERKQEVSINQFQGQRIVFD